MADMDRLLHQCNRFRLHGKVIALIQDYIYCVYLNLGLEYTFADNITIVMRLNYERTFLFDVTSFVCCVTKHTLPKFIADVT